MRRLFVSVLILLTTAGIIHAQSVYQPYSYDFYQKFNADIYATTTRTHTSLKPFFLDDTLLKRHADSLFNYNKDGKDHSWGYRKLFNEHLIDVQNGSNSL